MYVLYVSTRAWWRFFFLPPSPPAEVVAAAFAVFAVFLEGAALAILGKLMERRCATSVLGHGGRAEAALRKKAGLAIFGAPGDTAAARRPSTSCF